MQNTNMPLPGSADESPTAFSIDENLGDATNTTTSSSSKADSNLLSIVPTGSSLFSTTTKPNTSTPTLFGTNNATLFSKPCSTTAQPTATAQFGCGSNTSSGPCFFNTAPKSTSFGQSFFNNGYAQHQDHPMSSMAVEHSTPSPFGWAAFAPQPQPLFSFTTTKTHLDARPTPTLHLCQNCGHKSLWRASQQWGSNGLDYTPTPFFQERPNLFGDYVMILHSISAMPFYQHKSHEELRWEDYQAQGKSNQKKSTTSGVIIKVRQPSRFYILLKKVMSFVAILVIARLLQRYFEE
ncbi:nuclear pore complex protein NUP98B-like isoform X2 [Humulus lupulus]|uniref:nuclear pore complex protein NUP98B-like isoform X2 n=1 Tax=Humulus lupulus TaxID=3486 RepID=UPI002B408C10|nr:nuclear pore complex protein NUP98B-like isoform X2 [Humulus lupulus]